MKQTMGRSGPDQITLRGKDLCAEIIGKRDFSSKFFLELTGRPPSPDEARVVSAGLVTLMEHGPAPGSPLVSPISAPNALEGAVAAGNLGPA